jgi:hypothetical protein
LNALNSGITAAKVSTYDWYATGKQDTLVSWTNIKTVNSQSLLWNGNISINWILSGPLVPAASATYAGRIWFDTTNNVFLECDWTSWKVIDINTKTFKLSSSSDLSTAQSAYDRIIAWNYAIVIDWTIEYIFEPTNITTWRITSRWVRWVQFFESLWVFNETLDLEYIDVTNWVVTWISWEEWRHASWPYVSESLVPPSNPGAWALWCPQGTSNLQIYNWTQWVPILTSSTWLQESPNSTITGIKYIRHWTEADYANLSQYYTDTPWDTEFHCF